MRTTATQALKAVEATSLQNDQDVLNGAYALLNQVYDYVEKARDRTHFTCTDNCLHDLQNLVQDGLSEIRGTRDITLPDWVA